MRLHNKGKRRIYHAEDFTSTVDPKTGKAGPRVQNPKAHATPDAYFEVSDDLGVYLKKLYPKELRSFDDAKKEFEEPLKKFTGTPDPVSDAPKTAAEKTDDEIMAELESEAKTPKKK